MINRFEGKYFFLSNFSNSEFCYEGIIHEQPKEILPVIKTNIVINHYGYLSDDCNLMIYKLNIVIIYEKRDRI